MPVFVQVGHVHVSQVGVTPSDEWILLVVVVVVEMMPASSVGEEMEMKKCLAAFFCLSEVVWENHFHSFCSTFSYLWLVVTLSDGDLISWVRETMTPVFFSPLVTIYEEEFPHAFVFCLLGVERESGFHFFYDVCPCL